MCRCTGFILHARFCVCARGGQGFQCHKPPSSARCISCTAVGNKQPALNICGPGSVVQVRGCQVCRPHGQSSAPAYHITVEQSGRAAIFSCNYSIGSKYVAIRVSYEASDVVLEDCQLSGAVAVSVGGDVQTVCWRCRTEYCKVWYMFCSGAVGRLQSCMGIRDVCGLDCGEAQVDARNCEFCDLLTGAVFHHEPRTSGRVTSSLQDC